jgi:heme/copper-type cytochrome/quinol oxidase subunit 2
MSNNIMKQLSKNLLLLFICSAGVVTVLVREFNHRLLSPHGLQIAMLMLAIGMSTGAVLIILKSAKKYRGLSKTADEVPQGRPTRERRPIEIRVAQLCIIILVILLFWGLHGIGKETLLPTLVGVAINLSITVLLIRWVMRRKKNMN